MCTSQSLISVASLCRSLFACSVSASDFGTHLSYSQKVSIKSNTDATIMVHAGFGFDTKNIVSNTEPLRHRKVVNPYHFIPLIEIGDTHSLNPVAIESTEEPLRVAACSDSGEQSWALTVFSMPISRCIVSVWNNELFFVVWPALIFVMLEGGGGTSKRKHLVLSCALSDLLLCASKIAAVYYYSEPSSEDYGIMITFLGAHALVCAAAGLSETRWIAGIGCLVSLATTFFGTTTASFFLMAVF